MFKVNFKDIRTTSVNIFIMQDFKSLSGHFSLLSIEGLNSDEKLNDSSLNKTTQF